MMQSQDTCSVCGTNWDTPRVSLPCLHSVCNNCAQNCAQESEKVTCPICGQLSTSSPMLPEVDAGIGGEAIPLEIVLPDAWKCRTACDSLNILAGKGNTSIFIEYLYLYYVSLC